MREIFERNGVNRAAKIITDLSDSQRICRILQSIPVQSQAKPFLRVYQGQFSKRTQR